MRIKKYITSIFISKKPKCIYLPIIILTLVFYIQGFSQESVPNKTNNYTILLGGNIGFENSKSDIILKDGQEKKLTTTKLQIIPKIGFFISPSFIVGIKFGFNNYENAPLLNNTIVLSGGAGVVSLFGRYQKNLTQKLNGFVELNFEYEQSIGLFEIRYSSINVDYARQTIAANFGLIYKITQHSNIEFSLLDLNYSRARGDGESKYTTSFLKLNYNLIRPNLGLTFYF